MSLTKIGSIGINTGIQFAGVTTVSTLHVGSGVTLSSDGDVFATGISTFSEDIKVGSGVTISPDGDGFFTGVITATSYSGIDLSAVTGATDDFSIADKIVHTGDTNTAIRFPSADTITAETSGTEALRIDSSGNVNFGAEAANTAIQASGPFSGATPKLEVKLGGASNSYTRLINIANPSGATGSETLGRVGIKLALGNESNSTETAKAGIIYAESTSNFNNSTSLCFATSNTERARIDSSGHLGVGLSPADSFSFGKAIDAGSTSGAFYYARDTDGGSDAVGGFGYSGSGLYIGNEKSDGFIRFSTNTSATERMRIDSNGKLLVNHTSARIIAGGNSLVQVEAVDSTGRVSIVQNRNEAEGAPFLSLGKSRGTSVGSNTVVQSGDTLGTVAFAGADGTDLSTSAVQIVAQVDGTPGSNDMPGRLIIKTCADGASSTTERVRIDSSGNIMFGTTSSTIYDDSSGSGVVIRGATGALDVMRDNDHPFLLNRNGGDGQMCMYHRDGVNKAASAIRSGHLCFDLPSGTEKIRFQSTGGISFNGDTATANALDDYEEGTFSLDESNISVSNFETRYTKIGRAVMLSGRLIFGTSSNTSTLNLTGLPFTPDSGAGNSTCGGVIPEQNLGLGAIFMAVEHGNNTIRIRKDNGAVINPSNASGKTLRFVLWYVAST